MKKKYPLWIALIIYWSSTFLLLSESLKKSRGHFGYPIDDTYIHMAIAKHFANNGIWGVSQNAFSSSTSSPLWTLLLAAAYRVVGVREWIPFAICLLFGSVILFICYRLLQDNSNPVRVTIFLISIILFIPLPILTLTGMEHILHSLFSLWLVYGAAVYLAQDEPDRVLLNHLLPLAALVTITRYEGIFLVFSIMFLLLIKRKFLEASLMMGAGLLPLTIYGFISTSQGWYFLPNSILLKGNTPVFTQQGIGAFLSHLPDNLLITPHILVLLLACSIVYLWCKKAGRTGKVEGIMTAIFILITLLHLQFARVGWFYRYEAYLVLIGCMVLFRMLNLLFMNSSFHAADIWKYTTVVTLAMIFTTPFTWRTTWAFQQYPVAVTNIYEQQYQMGLFLEKYYSGKAVAANDIGAINYVANIKTLDLFGLGSIEVAHAKQNGSFDKSMIRKLVAENDTKIVIIYRQWFEGEIPSEWVEVGRWKISNNIACAFDEVVFYVPNSSLEKEAIANLQDFSTKLPSTVLQTGKYVSP